MTKLYSVMTKVSSGDKTLKKYQIRHLPPIKIVRMVKKQNKKPLYFVHYLLYTKKFLVFGFYHIRNMAQERDIYSLFIIHTISCPSGFNGPYESSSGATNPRETLIDAE